MENEIVVIENQSVEVFSAQERAVIDSQIATAKAYPRNLLKIKDNCIAIVSMDKGTAESCRYTKPVAGKQLSGVSVHCARILAQQYGNIRIQQRIKNIGQREIVAEAVAFDLETNYAITVEARRSIIDRNGQRYKDSVIETNAMAILAIAERNAILKIIPKGLIDTVYNSAFNTANGDLSDEQKVLSARKKAIDHMAKKYGANEKDVLNSLGLRDVNQIGKEEVATLRGYVQSLNDGEITANELFGWEKVSEPAPNPITETKEPVTVITEGKLL